jgi:FAD/FMN-containing dehydrogenase
VRRFAGGLDVAPGEEAVTLRNRMKDFDNATQLLRRKLGSKLVLTDDAALEAASYDSSRIAVRPSAVVKVTKREQIGVMLKLANEHGVPVTPRGRGTTLMGSAVPLHGGWVLDLLGLDKIVVDTEAGLAHVQAGVKVGDVQKAAAAAGWFYPPDPSSKDYSTIGGNVACNAGGMHGGKYGVTRDFVVALKGYLPTGEFVEWGTATRKFAAGFNLRDLWIGSEGMLGVVTDAVLRLIPAPAARWTLLTSFADEVAAFRAARALFAARVQPAICEFLDRASVTCAERAMKTTIFPGQPGRPVILIELAGSVAELKDAKKAVLAWAALGGAAQVLRGDVPDGRRETERGHHRAARRLRRVCGVARKTARLLGARDPDLWAPRGRESPCEHHVSQGRAGRMPRGGEGGAGSHEKSSRAGRCDFGRARHRARQNAFPEAPAFRGADRCNEGGEAGARSQGYPQPG